VNPLVGVLAEAWAVYRAHARHLLSIAFVIYVVAAAIEALLSLDPWIGRLRMIRDGVETTKVPFDLR
jgi:hypothetical protein